MVWRNGGKPTETLCFALQKMGRREYHKISKRAVDRGAKRTFWRLQGETEPLHSLIKGNRKAGQSGTGLAGKQETHSPTSPPT